MGAARISILLVDDQTLMRELLANRLQREEGIEVAGQVGDADQALEKAIALRPRVVLLDVDMPGLLSFECARIVRIRCPDTRVLFLSHHRGDHFLNQAVSVGAAGYVLKRDGFAVLLEAIRSVADGGVYFSPEINASIVVDADGIRACDPAEHDTSTLSTREAEVLHYVAQGMSNRQIADLMHLSARTIESHLSRVMSRYGIKRRAELVALAVRKGLIEP